MAILERKMKPIAFSNRTRRTAISNKKPTQRCAEWVKFLKAKA